MKGRAILHGTLAGQRAAALMVDGRIEDLFLDPPAGIPRPGAIYRAKAGRPVKGLGGVFVELGAAGRGFLRSARPPAPGRSCLVQVSAHAEPGKAPPVSDRLRLKGRLAILTPGAAGANLSRGLRGHEVRARLTALAGRAAEALPEACGLILRSAAGAAEEDEIEAEIRVLGEHLAALGTEHAAPILLLDGPDAAERARREWGAPGTADEPDAAFDAHGVIEALAALAGPVPLPGGAMMTVEATRALVAVDVNTGADTSPAAGLKANLAAIQALPRHLRLAGLGGQIVIDPAPMPKPARDTLEQALKTAFRADAVDTQPLGWTALGHYELRRKRARWPVPLAALAEA